MFGSPWLVETSPRSLPSSSRGTLPVQISPFTSHTGLGFCRGWSICLQCGRPEFNPWVGKIPWRRKWQPTPVLLPGQSHGRRSLVGYHPRVAKSQTRLSDFTFTFTLSNVSSHCNSLFPGWQLRAPNFHHPTQAPGCSITPLFMDELMNKQDNN